VDFAHFFICNFLQKLFWRCFTISIKECAINEEIKGKEVRLIDVDGSQLGIVSVKDALAKAEEKNLDLVEISPQAKPPVCKIMDYGKYRFEQAKREKETKKNQKVVNVKEVKMSPSIDVHDFNTKVNQAAKFLKSGDKVKITVKFRGRELHHASLGQEVLERVAEALSEVGNVEKQAKLEGRNMAMVVVPKQN
jgi:translation initiation factor IF-3